MHVCVLHACSVHGGQKRVSDPLELESQTVVSCQVGAGHQTQVFLDFSAKTCL